jgi:hypothetical protein
MEKVGEHFKVFIGSMFGTSMDHVEMIVEAEREHVGAFYVQAFYVQGDGRATSIRRTVAQGRS